MIRSKIGKLPSALRETLNQRLHENAHSGAELAAWLTQQSGGIAVNEQNISDWRRTGFAEWQEDQRRTERVRRLSDLAVRVAEAGAGENLTEAAVKIAAGKIMPMLELAEADQLPDIIAALDKLASKELAARKDRREADSLALAREREAREKERLSLDKEKFARDSARLFLKWHADQRARDIAAGAGDEDTKVGELVQLYFGDMPDGIGPQSAPSRNTAVPPATGYESPP